MFNCKARIALAVFLCFCAGTLAFSSDVATEATQIQPLLIGSKVPAISLTDPEGNPFDLTESLSETPTVLIFYRGSW